MGTLATIGANARVKARDVDENLYEDADLVKLVNGILHEIYDELKGIESNLVYAEDTQETADGTPEYTPSFSFEGIMNDGVWLDGEDQYMSQVDEADKVKYSYGTQTSPPEVFYLTEDGKIGFLSVPDAIYTVHIQYWKPLTELTTYASDPLPWYGIWNQFIEENLVLEMLAIQERDISTRAVKLDIAHGKCLGKTYQRGIRSRKFVSDFFSVDGI